MESKKRSKLASGIADPGENPELFEEAWEEALEKEKNGGGEVKKDDGDEDEEDEDEEEEDEEEEEEE